MVIAPHALGLKADGSAARGTLFATSIALDAPFFSASSSFFAPQPLIRPSRCCRRSSPNHCLCPWLFTSLSSVAGPRARSFRDDFPGGASAASSGRARAAIAFQRSIDDERAEVNRRTALRVTASSEGDSVTFHKPNPLLRADPRIARLGACNQTGRHRRLRIGLAPSRRDCLAIFHAEGGSAPCMQGSAACSR